MLPEIETTLGWCVLFYSQTGYDDVCGNLGEVFFVRHVLGLGHSHICEIASVCLSFSLSVSLILLLTMMQAWEKAKQAQDERMAATQEKNYMSSSTRTPTPLMMRETAVTEFDSALVETKHEDIVVRASSSSSRPRVSFGGLPSEQDIAILEATPHQASVDRYVFFSRSHCQWHSKWTFQHL